MNALGAGPGWRDVAIWVMPPVAYALASDTAIGVVRAYTLARQGELDGDLAEDEATPLTVLGGVLLWVLRLAVAPPSTLSGLRSWVIEECPVAPGRVAASITTASAETPPAPVAARTDTPPAVPQQRQARGDSKTARFLALAQERHGPMATIDPRKVASIAKELAPQVDLHQGSARSALRSALLASQTGGAS
jgi:hypothetical protein